MDDYQKSVLDERDAFIPQFAKTAQFIDSPDFTTNVPDPADQELMRQQARVMGEYLAILNARAQRVDVANAAPIPIVTVGPGTDAHTAQSVGTVAAGTPMTEEGMITRSVDATEVHPIPGAKPIDDASVATPVGDSGSDATDDDRAKTDDSGSDVK